MLTNGSKLYNKSSGIKFTKKKNRGIKFTKLKKVGK